MKGRPCLPQQRVDVLQAKLTDGREFVASAVGTDPATDIAVLRLHTTDGVPVVPIGDSSSLSVGQVTGLCALQSCKHCTW